LDQSGSRRQQPDDGELLADVVRDGRVNSKIYTDPAIFELEMARIFSKTWVYVGHASEVPAAGDYQTRSIGRTPVIMVRGADRQVRVLLNRCRHRGAQVCETSSGNAKMFRCWYHGWVYDSAGALVEVPDKDGYGGRLDQDRMGLVPVPRVDSYRGFMFASLAPDGEPLASFLGAACAAIDLLVDASPTGEIFADGGSYKTEYRGNWKLVGMDGYHTPFVHASVFAAKQKSASFNFELTHRDGSHDDGVRARDFGNGHTMLDYRPNALPNYEKRRAALLEVPGGPEYIDAMHKAHEQDRARMLISLAGDAHLGIFPNLQLIQNQIRIITPLAADRTQIVMTAVRLGGVSDAINARRLRRHEYFYGPAGAGAPDDAEIFERAQRGMMAEVDPWIEISRGIEREQTDADGSVAALHADEVPQRAMIQQWMELMTEAQ
jgi:phenylpropionate dioxygenase-like ring-hydroxylating dioxygenase large terminal subunit